MLKIIFDFYWPNKLQKYDNEERGNLHTCAVHFDVHWTLRTKATVEQGAL